MKQYGSTAVSCISINKNSNRHQQSKMRMLCALQSKFLRSLIASLFALNLFSPGLVYGASQADIEAAQRQAEIFQRQEQERLRSEREDLRRRTESVDGLDTELLVPKVDPTAVGVDCRDIDTIVITNAPNLSDELKATIDNDFSGRCLGVGDIEKILAEITSYYIHLGLVTTRAYLPPQDLSQGQLNILVIEGSIEKIDIEDGDKNSVSIDNIFPNGAGELLNLRDLEQGIDQINRLRSNNARLDIQPGSKPGTSRVVVKNEVNSPYYLNISFDNQGSRSTGRNQAGLFASGDNLLGYNDSLSISHRQTIPADFNRQNTISDSLNFSVPFGYNTLYAGASYSEYDSGITLPSDLVLISSGSNKNFNIRLDRVMYRDQNTRSSLSAMFTLKESKNYLGGEFLAVSSRRLAVVDLDGNVNAAFAGGVLSVDLGYAMGLSTLGALKDISGLPVTAPRAQFSKFKIGFSYARSFAVMEKNLSFRSSLTGQKSSDTLFGSEQISIGGLYSVRGFYETTLSGDHGYYWRNELSLPHTFVVDQYAIPSRFYVGFDMGKVFNRIGDIPEGRLTGMVLGVSGSWKKFSWDVFNARPLSVPNTLIKESSETWFRLSHSI